jgi:ABC-type sugar transport system substrate-binding protein
MNFLKKTSLALAACGMLASAAQAEPIKAYLSMSYIGNDWQDEAAMMVRAMTLSSAYKDKVVFETQVAGPNPQKQIQQINAMVQAGAKIIVIYPISPTALNQVVTVLGQQALFFLTLFDMGDGKNPNYRRTLLEAQKEFSEREARVTGSMAN